MKKNVRKYDDFVRLRYNYQKHSYERVIVPLVLCREYWGIWSKNGVRKLKKTVIPPRRNHDSYGWTLDICYEVCTCVRLRKYEVIYL